MAESIEPTDTNQDDANLSNQGDDAYEDDNQDKPLSPSTAHSFVASDSDADDNKLKTPSCPGQPTAISFMTSLSHHDQSKTVTNVQNLFQKGEQPKTDKYEIWAWYCYDWANSPFGGVATSLLIPLLLTNLAEEFGCSQAAYGCDINAHNIETQQLIQVSVGVWELKATSYAAAMIGLSSLIQAIVYIFVGPIADYGRYRTLLFRITSIGAGIATCLYVFFGDKSLWQFVGWWTVIATVIYGLSIIFYNSWLPILVETHEDIISACKNGVPQHELTTIIEQKTDHLALVGFAWGYCAGIVVLLICLAILLGAPAAYIYDEDDVYGAMHGAENVFIDSNIATFSEVYARDITAADLYYSVADNFVFIHGLQFVYNGFDGDIHGSNDGTLQSLDFDPGVDEVIIFTQTSNDHICGFSFHVKGEDKNIYSNIGNVTDTNSDVTAYKISEKDMLFGGISGNIGTLNSNISIATASSTALASISILFVNAEGQFSAGTLYQRLGILINGLWFLIFTLISIKYLKHRPGPALPENERLYLFGLKTTLKTMRKARQFPTLFTYLLAYFLFSDGVGTLVSCGVLFGRELLDMSDTQLAIMILEVYVFGTIGAYCFLKCETKYNIASKHMLCIHLVCLCVLPIWGLIGIIPSSPIGFKLLPEIYIWSFFMAIHIGSIQSFARSVFAQLSPVGHESEMFALYEITDKGSSWIGPLVIAFVSDLSDMRWAVFYIFLFFLIPLPIIWKLDMQKGRFEAGRSMHQVTRRASMLFDVKSMDDLQNDLQDIVEEVVLRDEKEKELKDKTTAQALEMAIEAELTVNNARDDDEKP